MEKLFEQKVAIITGGSFGIGRATAIAFARRGAKVVIADVVEDNTTLQEIKNEGDTTIFVKCDVSKSSDVTAMVNQTIKAFGRLDYAVNNAGIEGATADTHECTEENWDKIIGINLKGIRYKV